VLLGPSFEYRRNIEAYRMQVVNNSQAVVFELNLDVVDVVGSNLGRGNELYGSFIGVPVSRNSPPLLNRDFLRYPPSVNTELPCSW